jgi:hypothetical protein
MRRWGDRLMGRRKIPQVKKYLLESKDGKGIWERWVGQPG